MSDKINFKKLGIIFDSSLSGGWSTSHASNPTPFKLTNDTYRVFFSARDTENKSHVSYADIRLPSFEVLYVSERPVISPGIAGSFDDRGCSVGCAIEANGKLYLYYLGWNLSPDVPFQNSIGLAESTDQGKTFVKSFSGPILDRSIYDPYSVSYPYVFKSKDEFIMIYGSHKTWGPQISDMIHGLKIAKSKDLFHWDKTSEFIVDANDDDYAFSRPWVLNLHGKRHMLYCFRGSIYKIGLAECLDDNFQCWKRVDDLITLNLSEEGWDSQMICYPSIVEFESRTFLLYCGNGYGKSGFGAAEIVS